MKKGPEQEIGREPDVVAGAAVEVGENKGGSVGAR